MTLGSTWSFENNDLVKADIIAKYGSDFVVVKPLARPFKTDRDTLDDLNTVSKLATQSLKMYESKYFQCDH